MKIYAVMAWDEYYPGVNNTIKAFTDAEKAKEFCIEYTNKMRNYEVFDMDFCKVIEIEVET